MMQRPTHFTKEQAYKTRETQKRKKQKKQNVPFNAQHHPAMHSPLPRNEGLNRKLSAPSLAPRFSIPASPGDGSHHAHCIMPTADQLPQF